MFPGTASTADAQQMPINSFSPGCFIQGPGRHKSATRGFEVRVLTSVEMIPHREEGHVKGHIPHCWVGLEDGDDGNLNEHEEDRVLPRAGQSRKIKISYGPGSPQRFLTPALKPKNILQGILAGSATHKTLGTGCVAEKKTVETQRCSEVVRRAQQTLEKQPTEIVPINRPPTSSKPSPRSL